MILIDVTTIATGVSPLLSSAFMFAGGNSCNAGILVVPSDWKSLVITLEGSLDNSNWVTLKQLSGSAATFNQAAGSQFFSLAGMSQNAFVRCNITRPSSTLTGRVLVQCDNLIALN